MVFQAGSPHSDLSKLHIDQHGNGGLNSGHNHVHILVRVKNGALIRIAGKPWDVPGAPMVFRPYHTIQVQEADNYGHASDQTRHAESERSQVAR